jgi:hypothetical protein
MTRHPVVRFSGRLRRCRNCGIRVRRESMVYNFLACSEDCADELWISANSDRERSRAPLE